MDAWSSRLGFLLAAIGSAVGIGNIWRFSSVVGQNGGGAYLIPFFLAVFAFALPLMILELAVGRHLKENVVSAFRRAGPGFHIFGWFICVVVLLILSYYLVITGWTLFYLISSLLGHSVSFSGFSSSYQPVAYFVVSALVTGAVVSLGVREGIEKISKILIPFSLLILVALALYATTLSGFGQGVDFFLTPDFGVLGDPLIWSAAFGQAFFSLSVGFGVLITYGSYLDRETSIPRSSLIIALADLSIAMLAGLIIFPIVFTQGLTPTMGAELAFSTLPAAFERMPSGHLLATSFFMVLFFAAITSSIAMLEVNVAAVTGATGVSRKKGSLLLTIALLLMGLPSALSYSSLSLRVAGARILDLMDETVGTLGLPLTGLITAVVFTWFLKKEAFSSEIASRRWLSLVYPATRYVIPAVLVVVTASTLLISTEVGVLHFVPDTEWVTNLARGVVLAVMASLLLLGRAILKSLENL
ncbi:MAG TPA: sodium-dependent transporter [Thermoplasmatales archaeon]|nr:sodium-dependent transporter [Thermoplasmatales archaeon]